MLIVAAMLRQLGAEVLEAIDGEEAVAMALEHAVRIDAVLMDQHMPGLDGLAATRRLRAEPVTQTLPIFAFSAAVLDNERREAEASGSNGFVTKPATELDLVRALRPTAPALGASVGALHAPGVRRTGTGIIAA
jgi:CheY-like chemotaxis protein